jgi:hypothetical protein
VLVETARSAHGSAVGTVGSRYAREDKKEEGIRVHLRTVSVTLSAVTESVILSDRYRGVTVCS